MLAIRKLNNNAVICRDSLGREVIALGKGVGFGSDFPREISFDDIERTFYDIDPQGQRIMQDLPAEVVVFTAKVMDIVANEVPYELGRNVVLVMADHLSFAIERQQKGIRIGVPFAFDVQQVYPLEYRMGRYIVSRVARDLGIELPDEEIASIAMNLVNARVGTKDGAEQRETADIARLLDGVISIIERDYRVVIDRDSFDYARFATHVQYLYRRIRNGESISSANSPLYESTRNEFPELARCIDHIGAYLAREFSVELRDEEKLYLMLHVNRICSKTR